MDDIENVDELAMDLADVEIETAKAKNDEGEINARLAAQFAGEYADASEEDKKRFIDARIWKEPEWLALRERGEYLFAVRAKLRARLDRAAYHLREREVTAHEAMITWQRKYEAAN